MGYGIYGFSQGLQSGMGMGMQLRNMQWQNEERKKIELKAEETKTALTDFFGSSFGQTMMTGGNLSANDKTMFMTALQGATAEARGVMGSVYSAWQQGDRETYKREMDRLNILLEFYGGNNKFDIANMEQSFNNLEQTFTHEDAKNACIAGRNIMSSREKPMDTTRLDIAVKGTGTGSPASLAEVNQLLGTDYKVEDVSEEQGKIVHNAAVTLNNAAVLGKSSFTAVLNQMKLDAKYKEAGIDLDSISYDTWTAPTPTGPADAADIRDVNFSIDKIKNAENPKEAQVFANAHIKEFGDLSALGIEGTSTDKYWGENQRFILSAIARDIGTLINEKGFVRPEELTKRNLLGAAQTMSNADWYKALYNDYMTLYEELKALGVDMTGFKKLHKLEDIGKIKGWAPKPGIKQGDWRTDGWWINE